MQSFTVNSCVIIIACFVFSLSVSSSDAVLNCTDALNTCNSTGTCRAKYSTFTSHCDALLQDRDNTTVCSSACATYFHGFLQDSSAQGIETCVCNIYSLDVCLSTVISNVTERCRGIEVFSTAATSSASQNVNQASSMPGKSLPIYTLHI